MKFTQPADAVTVYIPLATYRSITIQKVIPVGGVTHFRLLSDGFEFQTYFTDPETAADAALLEDQALSMGMELDEAGSGWEPVK